MQTPPPHHPHTPRASSVVWLETKQSSSLGLWGHTIQSIRPTGPHPGPASLPPIWMPLNSNYWSLRARAALSGPRQVPLCPCHHPEGQAG